MKSAILLSIIIHGIIIHAATSTKTGTKHALEYVAQLPGPRITARDAVLLLASGKQAYRCQPLELSERGTLRVKK